MRVHLGTLLGSHFCDKLWVSAGTRGCAAVLSARVAGLHKDRRFRAAHCLKIPNLVEGKDRGVGLLLIDK